MLDLIKSPINYTGNKYRLIPQFEPFFPKESDSFVDLFCGGATVGFNVSAKKIFLIDNNPRIIDLLNVLAKNDINKTIDDIEKIIKDYGLSYSKKNTYSYYRKLGVVDGNNGLKAYNKKGFYELREKYNSANDKSSYESILKLYVLMVYGFNNDIRFSSKGLFNLPVGKTDFNKNNYDKIVAFNKRANHINFEFICDDFTSQKVSEIILESSFTYCDPPYLITDAVYNENGGWNARNEQKLLDLLFNLSNHGKSFALSNVLEKENKDNSLLKCWIETNGFIIHDISYHYRSSSYNKKNRNANEREVLITNKELLDGNKNQ